MTLFDKLPTVFMEALKADAALAEFQKQAAASGYDAAVSNYHLVRDASCCRSQLPLAAFKLLANLDCNFSITRGEQRGPRCVV